MNFCMIDIETCGQRANAPVLSIGAVKFDPNTAQIGETYYAAVDPSDAFRNGVPDGGTFKWWMEQGDQARAAAVGGTSSLADALNGLGRFYANWKDVKVFGNGPSFDMTILEHAYGRIGKPAPWRFWNVLDCRTVAAMAGKRPPAIGGSGVYHNALDDAVHQAKWVSQMWRDLKGLSTQIADDDLL